MLPTVATPTFEVVLPSTNKKVRLRPFLVKEEKLLLIAAYSKDTNEIINTTKDVVSACFIDKDVNINDLTFFDMDYLFVALRAKSVGETIEVQLTCNHKVEGNKCSQIFPVNMDITKIHVVKDDKIQNRIMISDDVGVQMKYPKYSTIKKIMSDDNEIEKKTNLICASIDFIYDKEKIYSSKDYTKEDLLKFIENLTKQQEKKLNAWVDSFPYLELRVEKECPKCKFNHKLSYKDFTSFFF